MQIKRGLATSKFMNDIFSHLKLVLDSFLISLSDFMPLFIFGIILGLIAILILRLKVSDLLETIFFSIIGILVAYLTYLSRDTLLKNVLPSLIVLLSFVFQLFWKNKQQPEPSKDIRIIFLAGIISVIMFLLSSRYFILVFGR